MEFGAAVEEATAFMYFLPLKPKQVEALQNFMSGFCCPAYWLW